MKAIYCPRYGGPDVLELRDMPRPQLRKGHLVVAVRAVAVTSGDARVRGARFPKGMGMLARLGLGLFGPRKPVLGFSFAGEVVEVAPDVSTWQPGQRVLGMTGMGFGAYAEFKHIRADAPMVQLPDNLSYDFAAALSFGGTTALDYLRHKAKVQPGEKVLVLGASGQVGIAGVQIARALGAEVTATCSARNAAFVAEMGATQVVDYRTTDVTQLSTKYDVIMDCVGASNFRACNPILAANGRYLVISGGLRDLLGAMRRPDAQGRQAIAGVAGENAADLQQLLDWAQEGVFDPVITARFPLEDAHKAHALIDTGRKVGSVVLQVG